MQNQTNRKHFSNSEDIFKSAKNFLEKRNRKEEVKVKIIREGKLQSNITTLVRLRFL